MIIDQISSRFLNVIIEYLFHLSVAALQFSHDDLECVTATCMMCMLISMDIHIVYGLCTLHLSVIEIEIKIL